MLFEVLGGWIVLGAKDRSARRALNLGGRRRFRGQGPAHWCHSYGIAPPFKDVSTFAHMMGLRHAQRSNLFVLLK